ncbi:hypothetical protein Tco_0972232 [Tanacetum coccineum]
MPSFALSVGDPGQLQDNCPSGRTESGNKGGIPMLMSVELSRQNPDNNVVTGPEVCATRMSRIFGTYYRQGRLETNRRRSNFKMYRSVQKIPKVFPEDLPGLPPTRQVEFHIDLVPVLQLYTGTLSIIAPFKMKRIGDQLQELSDKAL